MTVTSDTIAELERTLKAMKAYQKGQEGRTYPHLVWNKKTKVYDRIEGPDLWPSADVNHSAAGRASMDCTKALAKWRQAPKSWGKAK